ncbi:MAG: DoxX family membrane protein [bacterium]|nr:DoxX family membrane protein [bacterium]
MEILFLVARVLFGGYFFMNGINHFLKSDMMVPYTASKGVPLPKLAVLGSGLMILLGGLGILLGVYVEWAVALLVVFIVVVTLKMHNFWTIGDPNARMMDMIMFMKNVALLGGALAFLFIPTPWAFSLIGLL